MQARLKPCSAGSDCYIETMVRHSTTGRGATRIGRAGCGLCAPMPRGRADQARDALAAHCCPGADSAGGCKISALAASLACRRRRVSDDTQAEAAVADPGRVGVPRRRHRADLLCALGQKALFLYAGRSRCGYGPARLRSASVSRKLVEKGSIVRGASGNVAFAVTDNQNRSR